MKRNVTIGLMLLIGAGLNSAQAADPDPELAQKAFSVMKKYCYSCHGVEFNGSQKLNVLDRDVLVASRGKSRSGEEKKRYVKPGKPGESYLWQRIEDGEMPPEDEAQPTDEERALISTWIEAGAMFPGRSDRPFVSDKNILAAILDYLKQTPLEDRKYQRFFTLTHLFNNNKVVNENDLRLYRAAMSKVANSLSWEPDIVVPKAIDRDETVYAVDLRHLGWDKKELWGELLKKYPYGLSYGTHHDRGLRELAVEVYHMAGTDLPHIRADWFIAAATRPPLYHLMLDLPNNATTLEKKLNVNVHRNFMNNRLARAGFATSGVSKQNRMVERHPASFGSYWKSYDFGPRASRGDLNLFPLGPDFKDHPYPHQVFGHAGGEMIFNLPNGLQGYLLTDEKDVRINEGPIEIVSDKLSTSGTPAIVNGLSCMACHRHGIIDEFEDSVRDGHGLSGEARLKVEQLYPTHKRMQDLMSKDKDRFLRSLEEATGPFLQVSEDSGKDFKEFPEPVGAIARLYNKDLTIMEVALELGIEKPDSLKAMIRGNRKLRRMGLGPLMRDATINRERWDSLRNFNSVFHETARELELGTPFRFF